MIIALIDPRSDPRYPAERDLRYRVLRAPLGMSRAQVGFAGEENALHFLAIEESMDGSEGQPIGCVIFDFSSGRLRAMAVEPSRQGQGIGAALVLALEAEVRSRGVAEISLHARAGVSGFYQRLGYKVDGEPFEEVGIPHLKMKKKM